MKVLVVEDDVGLAERLTHTLSQHHYQTEIAADGEAGLALIESIEYDFVLLDVHLPRLDGLSFCKQIREEGCELPVLLMTAEDTSTTKVAGLDAGADDYVVKPLDFDELLARMRALLRRGKLQSSPFITWGHLRLDPISYEVFCDDQRLHLTHKEYEILELLLRNPYRVFSLDDLIDRVWSIEKIPSDNAIRTHIKSLRRKLKKQDIKGIIETVYGMGYRLGPTPFGVAHDEQRLLSTCRDSDGQTSSARTSSAQTSSAQTSSAQTSSAQTKEIVRTNSVDDEPELEARSEPLSEPLDPRPLNVESGLQDIWLRHQPKYLSLVMQLRETLSLLTLRPSAPTPILESALKQSKAAVHTLKGALGSFGFVKASEVAAQIERLMKPILPLSELPVERIEPLIDSLEQCLRADGVFSEAADVFSDSAAQSAAGADAPSQAPALLYKETSSSDLESYQCLLVDSDTQLTQALHQQAALLNITLRVAHTIEAARQILSGPAPEVMIIDPDCAQSWRQGLEFTASVSHRFSDLSIAVISDRNSLKDRIQALRAGCHKFVQKPVEPAETLEIIIQLIAPVRSENTLITVLDDDPLILQYVERILSPLGFQLTLLSDPNQLWRSLEEGLPDLLTLDIKMPIFNGLEVCQALRSSPKTAHLPILFLSAYSSDSMMHQAFEVGADDYIYKPAAGAELASRILSRLKRLRLLHRWNDF